MSISTTTTRASGVIASRTYRHALVVVPVVQDVLEQVHVAPAGHALEEAAHAVGDT